MKCDICGCEETYVKSYEHRYNIKGKIITFTSERRFCRKCNNLVYDDKLDNKASELAITKYNEEYGITKEEIISLRKKYNLSQEQFSKIIGCAKKTLISYEKGKSIPNDNYLILLKSLIVNPEAIVLIIEANKEQFNDREYDKINERIEKSLPNNKRRLIFNIDDNLSEYNGYSKLSKDKVFNIILYFAENGIYKTKLLKEMFYADFIYYKNMCKSITGLEYAKLPFGPVPDQFEYILSECTKENIIDYNVEYTSEFECYNIKAKKKFNQGIFEEEELNTLKEIKNKFKEFGSKDIVDYSHKEKAFILTNEGDKISYDFAFDIDL